MQAVHVNSSDYKNCPEEYQDWIAVHKIKQAFSWKPDPYQLRKL